MYQTKEQDWKLFRKKLPLWQEAYMDKLNQDISGSCREKDLPRISSGNWKREFGKTREVSALWWI